MVRLFHLLRKGNQVLFIIWCRVNQLFGPNKTQGGGGTLIFSYIRRLGPFFGSQLSEFQYFFWVFRKVNIFWGMKILWIFFWGHPKIGLVLGVISMYFRVFS